MSTLLYILTVFIWGTTWIAIKFQLGHVPPMWSITYRFGLAALFLLIYCILTGKTLRFNLITHVRIGLQGLFMFCLNYFFFYIASEYLITGLLAVTFAMMAIFNIFLSRIILKTKISKLMLLGALLGVCGLVFIMHAELLGTSFSQMLHGHVLLAYSYCLLATLIASFATILAAINIKHNVPVLQGNALGMLYGSLIMAILALVVNHQPTFDWHFSYLAALAYLAIFGSVIAFGFYVTLIKHIGPERTSYVFVLTPIIAMIISTIFESFTWDMITFLGVVLVLLGNLFVMKGREQIKLK